MIILTSTCCRTFYSMCTHFFLEVSSEYVLNLLTKWYIPRFFGFYFYPSKIIPKNLNYMRKRFWIFGMFWNDKNILQKLKDCIRPIKICWIILVRQIFHSISELIRTTMDPIACHFAKTNPKCHSKILRFFLTACQFELSA